MGKIVASGVSLLEPSSSSDTGSITGLGNRSSDLFNIKHFKQTKGVDPNDLLQKPESFGAFNPNRCNLGKNLFDNHTRQQTKDVKLK